MTRTEAAEYALRAIELEREAVKHCDSLSNLEYFRLLRESDAKRSVAERFVETH